MLLFMDADSGFPYASLFTGPMTVASPISCSASEVGIPALLLLSYSSLENERHSADDSSNLSINTNPQFPQNLSPVMLSVIIWIFPQRGQLSVLGENTRFIIYCLELDHK